MSWIISRHRPGEWQTYRVLSYSDNTGTWEDAPGRLPKEYEYQFKALHQMYKEQDQEPDWEYEVNEYLR